MVQPTWLTKTKIFFNPIKWIFILVLLALVGFGIYWGYTAPWTGFAQTGIPDPNSALPAKRLWDWLELLIVPIVIAIIGTIIGNIQKNSEFRAADEKEKREILQDYYDSILNIILDGKLKKTEAQIDPANENPIQVVIRSKTTTTLEVLDDERKKSVLQFIARAKLINRMNPMILLDELTLNQVNFQQIELISVNLSGIEMEQAQLKNAQIFDADLSTANLSAARLLDSRFSYSIFQKTRLAQVNAKNCEFDNCQFLEARLDDARFSNCNFQRANFSGAVLQKVNFKGCSLQNASFSKPGAGNKSYPAIFLSTNFENANLTNAHFSNTNLERNVSFRGAVLDGANFTGARVSKHQLQQAKSAKGIKIN